MVIFMNLLNCGQDSFDDMELLHDVQSMEKYCPEVEDISLDDESLLNAVTDIENE